MADLKLGLGLGESSSTVKLKHLGFVRSMAVQVLDFWSNVYNSAKLKSGPLHPLWDTIEMIFIALFGGIYNLLKEVPDDILIFLDLKLDGHCYMFHKYAPGFVQEIVAKIHDLNVKALEVVQKFIGNIHTLGLWGAFESALWDTGKLFINEVKVFLLWLHGQPSIQKLELTLLPYLLPLAVEWAELYNKFVTSMRGKNIPVFRHLPLVAVEVLKAALDAIRHGENPFDKDKNLPTPSLPVPALPAPSLPPPRSLPAPSPPAPSPTIPSLPAPTLPDLPVPSPSLPVPSLPVPSLPVPSLPVPSLPNPLDNQKKKEGLPFGNPLEALKEKDNPAFMLPDPSLPVPSPSIPSLPAPSLPNPLDNQKKREGLPFMNPLEALKEKDNPAFM